MYSFEYKVRVRYADTDQMGYVYYGNYARYYEIARVEALRNLGFSYKSLEDSGIMMPVLELNTKYIRPARYDDFLTLKVFIKDFPKARIIFEYEIFNENNLLLNIGLTTLVFINRSTNRPCSIPEALAEKLKKYFE